MLTKEKIQLFLKENKWILVSVVFFLAWKFFLIGTLWENRLVPPTPDDSYVYINHIDSTLRCENLLSCKNKLINFETYTGVDHLSYRLLIGIFGKIFHMDAETTYHISFYLGTILLAGVLVIFLSILNKDRPKLVAFSLFILALYNGSGSYHGFFWVVPSFFALLYFILILSIILDDESPWWKLSLTFLTTLSLFNHIIGIYLLGILPLFLMFYSLLTKQFHLLILKKILFVGILSIIIYIPIAIYYTKYSSGNPYGPETIATNILTKNSLSEGYIIPIQTEKKEFNVQSLSTYFPSWKKLEENYFNWIFPNNLGYPLLIICIAILFWKKQYTILSLYFAGLTFSLLSTINVNGERSLIFIWPMTFLLYGQAWWFALQLISEKLNIRWKRDAAKTLLCIGLLFAILLSALYSYLWNVYVNRVRNIRVSEALASYLIQNTSPGEKITTSHDMDFLDSKLTLIAGDEKPERTIIPELATFYIALDQSKQPNNAESYKSTFESFFLLISKTLLFQKKTDMFDQSQNIPTNFESAPKQLFDDIIVYKKK